MMTNWLRKRIKVKSESHKLEKLTKLDINDNRNGRKEKDKQKLTKTPLKIGTWNTRSIKDKEEEIIIEMQKMGIEILGLTETKKKGMGFEKLVKDYYIYWSGVEETEWAQAGVAFIIHENKLADVRNERYVNERILAIDLEINKEPYTLIVSYGPNEDEKVENKQKFFDALQNEVDNTNNNLIIMGDLNGRVGTMNKEIEWCLGKYGEEAKNKNGERIIGFCLENDLVITNTMFKHKTIHKMTREDPHTHQKSLIDYFLISRHKMREIKDVRVRRSAEIGSDHFLVTLEHMENEKKATEIEKRTTKEKIKSYRLKEGTVKQAYQEKIKEKYKKEPEKQEIEETWHQFKKIILEAAQESCGKTKIGKGNKKRTPWWTEQIKQAVKQKKETWKKYLNNKSPQTYEEYKIKREQVKEMVKTAKQEAWVEFGNKIKEAYKDNQKLFYGALKRMRTKKNEALGYIRDEGGKLLTEHTQIMERWRQYFKSLLEDDDTYETPNSEDNEQQEENEYAMETITTEELEKAISKLKLGKAAGIDEITPEMIKFLNTEGKEKLLEILNIAYSEGITPQDWQTGLINPIHKKGDTKDCKNYRGITLLSVPGKIYARILENKIRQQLENSLEESQCGFRPGRGTQDLIFTLRQVAEKTIASGRQAHICFIDLQKAFDLINREDIWKSLKKREVNNNNIRAIRSLYKVSRNYIRLKHETSEVLETTRGLRQGCVLSPLLFSIILDDVIKECKKETKSYILGNWKMEKVKLTELAYADDMAIIGKNANDLQHNLNVYNRELKKKNMKINKDKTKTMLISNRKEQHHIQIEGITLEQVDKFKYLGSTLNFEGKIEDEISERLEATGRLFNAMKTKFLSKKEVPKHVKVEVFKKVVTPVLTYASESWTTSTKTISQITSMEMRFLRKIEGKTKLDRIRNETYRETLDTKPIEETVHENQLRWLGHTLRMTEDRIPKQVYEARIETRKRGRPRKTWKEEVVKAAEARGVVQQDIVARARDRKLWRETCKRRPQNTT